MTYIEAHRGFSGAYPENTMLAFQKAIELGCSGIELDVQLTKDGEVVIIHDESVNRTTDGHGLVREMTLQELQQLDASVRFVGKQPRQTIPTLREYFTYMADKPQYTNIEIKNSLYPYPGLEEKVTDMVREFGLTDRIAYSSFNHYSMLHCKKIAPEIPVGLLTSSWIVNSGRYGKELGANYINGILTMCSPERLAEIHSHGLGFNAWTADSEEHIRQLLAMGVRAIITNQLERALQIAGESIP